MNYSRLKGDDGEMRHESIEGLDERDLPRRLKVALYILNNLSDVLKREQFFDLIFEISGGKFHTHRLILAIWSPVIRNMMSNLTSNRMERIQLMYDKPQAFEQFITFLYTGNFDGNVTDVLPVLMLASTFQISLLRELCEEHLLQTVSVTNVISLFHVAVAYQLTCLEWQCADYIRQHLPEVAQHSEMKDLNDEQINAFLGSEHISRLDPEMKLFLLISWLTEDVINRQQFLVMLLGHIDWSSVADDFLVDISQTDNFFTSHPSSLYLLLQTLHSSSIPLGPYTEQFGELRDEYSYLLSSVVDSSAYIGMGKHNLFQPISLSLVTNSCSDKSIGKENDTSMSDKQLDSFTHFESDEEGHSHNEVTTGGKVSAAKSDTAMSHNVDSLVENVPKNLKQPCEGSMKRKRLRPRKFVAGSDNLIFSKPKSPCINVPKLKGKRAKDECSLKSNYRSPTKKSGKKNVQEETNHRHDVPAYSKAKAKAKASAENTTEMRRAKTRKSLRIVAKEKEPDKESVPSKEKGKQGKRKKGCEQLQFPCEECDRVFNKKQMLDTHHFQIHEGNRLFKCPLCLFECKLTRVFNEHLKSKHFSGPPFTCDYPECSFSANKIQTFMLHRQTHTDDRPFVCGICQMAFKSQSNLNSHLKCHNDEKKHQCPVCSRAFKLKINLEQHLVTHSDLRPYLCDLCGFSTKFQSHLISHRKKHAGDVFPCTFPSCTYSTPKQSQLKAHMRSHLGIRHHVCSECGKAFIEKYHLRRHERTHLMLKTHKCPLCDYASTRADKLTAHLKRHEKLDFKPEGRSEGTKKAKTKKKASTIDIKVELDTVNDNLVDNAVKDREKHPVSDVEVMAVGTEPPAGSFEPQSYDHHNDLHHNDHCHNDYHHKDHHHNDLHHNDPYHNDLHHNDLHHNDPYHNDLHHNDLHHNDLHHNDHRHNDHHHKDHHHNDHHHNDYHHKDHHHNDLHYNDHHHNDLHHKDHPHNDLLYNDHRHNEHHHNDHHHNNHDHNHNGTDVYPQLALSTAEPTVSDNHVESRRKSKNKSKRPSMSNLSSSGSGVKTVYKSRNKQVMTKQEMDINSSDLMTSEGFTDIADIQRIGNHQDRPLDFNKHYPYSLSPSSQAYDNESFFDGHLQQRIQQHQQRIQQHQQRIQHHQHVPSHHDTFYLETPQNDDMNNSTTYQHHGYYPPHRHPFHDQNDVTPSDHPPHPLIMVPNMNSSMASRPSFDAHPPHNSYLPHSILDHHHHHQELQQPQHQIQQESHQTSSYSHCDNYSY